MPKKKLNVRLPNYFVPRRYRIKLQPDLESRRFYGEETVYFSLAKPARRITLNAKDLKIISAAYKPPRGALIAPRAIKLDKARERAVFEFAELLPKGAGGLEIKFEGTLNDRLRGFYRSSYQSGGAQKHIAVTQFEATDARMAFPCADEPAAKAIFDLTLAVPKNHAAISNTLPMEVSESENGYRVVKFAPTPRMSTYLVALIAGEFESVETRTKRGTPVRVFVTPGKTKQAAFALRVAAKTLEFYEKYFGIPYPLAVLQMIAIPDFSSAAMENWGVVTYRESAILFDEKNSSTATKQWVALVIAHELAHQWFGNLVTMEWWTHLWLNEGFASYIEYLAVDRLFPKWDVWTQFAYADRESALHLDALKNTHPIEVEVRDPNEIGEIFDAISYQKGATVIRMLAEYLGERHFRAGLRRYLMKHGYANATTEDLWRAFEQVSRKPVRAIMRNWTQKPGYPLIKISAAEKGLLLAQSRFFSSGAVGQSRGDETVWRIPAIFRRETEKNRRVILMNTRRKTLPLSLKKDEWILLNAGAVGMYRVAYPPEMLAALLAAVSKKALSPEDRFSIESDAFALAEAGDLSTPRALSTAKAYAGEDNFTVWADLAANLGKLDALLADEVFYGRWREFAKNLFSRIAARMSWQKKAGEPHTAPMIRSIALYNFGRYGDRVTVAEAKRRFKIWAGGGAVEPDLRGVVYNLAAENGGAREYRILKRRYLAEPLQEERSRIARALGKLPDKDLLRATLDFSLTSAVRSQDVPELIAGVWANPRGREIAWRFLRSHWPLMLRRYGQGGHMLPGLVKPISVFASLAKAREVERFFRRHQAPGAARAVAQTIERIESNAAWLARDRARLRAWFQASSRG